MFDWSEAFETGIPEIDQQHQELFRIGEEINQLLVHHQGQDSYDEISECLEKLSEYTVFHFDTEEELFEKFDYADTEAHIKEHRTFVDYLNTLDVHHIDANQETAIKDLLKFVAMWIFKHINNTDFKYTSFIKDKLGIAS